MHLRFSLFPCTEDDGKPRSAAAILPPILAVVFSLSSCKLNLNNGGTSSEAMTQAIWRAIASEDNCRNQCSKGAALQAPLVANRGVLTPLHLPVGSEALMDIGGAVRKSRIMSNRLLLPPLAKKRCTGSRRSSPITCLARRLVARVGQLKTEYQPRILRKSIGLITQS